MKKAIIGLLIMILIISQTIIFSQDPSQEGMRLYINAMDAFQNRDYEKAQKLFEEALKIYPNIESRIKNIKLFIGISAYYNGDYEKAKIYLGLFKNNPVAQELLKKIPEDIEKKRPEDTAHTKEDKTSEGSTGMITTTNYPIDNAKNPSMKFFKIFLLGLIVFLASFLSILLIEYKFRFITGIIEKLLSKIFGEKKESLSNEKEDVENTAKALETNSNDFSTNNLKIYDVDIEEYSKKDLESIDEILKAAENPEENQTTFIDTGTKAETSNPREAILSSFNVNKEDDSNKSDKLVIEEDLKSRVEQIIKELKEQKKDTDSEWMSIEEESVDLEERIRELENKEIYDKEDIEKILEYVSKKSGKK